jgi:hypothetical protein
VDLIHHVLEYHLVQWIILHTHTFSEFLQEWDGVSVTLCMSDEAFLEVLVQCAVCDASSMGQAMKHLSLVEGCSFDLSLQVIWSVLYFPTWSWLSCEFRSFSSYDCLSVLAPQSTDHSSAKTKFLINMLNQLVTKLTISRISSCQHYENICMSFLLCLMFW